MVSLSIAYGSATASEAIQRIGKLCDIEREIRGKAASLRSEIRQVGARPLVDDLHRWFNKTLIGLSRKSDTAAAIRYALSRWRALGRYLDVDSSKTEVRSNALEKCGHFVIVCFDLVMRLDKRVFDNFRCRTSSRNWMRTPLVQHRGTTEQGLSCVQYGLVGELWIDWKDDTACLLLPAFGDRNAVWCG
jgi:hypothetical protein